MGFIRIFVVSAAILLLTSGCQNQDLPSETQPLNHADGNNSGHVIHSPYGDIKIKKTQKDDLYQVTNIAPHDKRLVLKRIEGWVILNENSVPFSGQINAGFARWMDWPLGSASALILPDGQADITTKAGLSAIIPFHQAHSAPLRFHLPSYQEHLGQAKISTEDWNDLGQPHQGALENVSLQAWLSQQTRLKDIKIEPDDINLNGTATLIFNQRPQIASFEINTSTDFKIFYEGPHDQLKSINGMKITDTTLKLEDTGYTLTLLAADQQIVIKMPR